MKILGYSIRMRGDGQARIKASQIMNNLAAVELIGPGRVDEVRAALPPEVLREVDQAAKTAWLPLEYDIALAEAIERVFGPGSDRERSRTSTRLSTESSLLRPILDGIQKIFGLTPPAVIRATTFAWGQLYRNCGEVKFKELAANRALLTYEGLPTAILDSPLYLASIGGGLHACLDLCKVEGSVRHRIQSRAEGKVEYEFEWQSPR